MNNDRLNRVLNSINNGLGKKLEEPDVDKIRSKIYNGIRSEFDYNHQVVIGDLKFSNGKVTFECSIENWAAEAGACSRKVKVDALKNAKQALEEAFKDRI